VDEVDDNSNRVHRFARTSAYSRAGGFIIFLGILYPVLIYFGSRHFSPRILALVLAVLVLGRGRSTFGARISTWIVAAGLLLALIAFGSNNALLLKLYPVVVNVSLLAVFASSLRYPPTIVECMARVRVPNLPQPAVVYTRRVTQAWCAFFAGNGLLALWTTWRWSDQAWFIYNGIIAYVLVGVFFAGEWLVRRRVLRGYHGFSSSPHHGGGTRGRQADVGAQ
jgi:uncharacterized membrane protein